MSTRHHLPLTVAPTSRRVADVKGPSVAVGGGDNGSNSVVERTNVVENMTYPAASTAASATTNPSNIVGNTTASLSSSSSSSSSLQRLLSSASTSKAAAASKTPADKTRRIEFVHHLVDCATQVIDSVWPAPPPTAANIKLLPLRLFVQEVLRRSRTSYITLQTALFYLTRVHGCPWTREAMEECHMSDADRVTNAAPASTASLATSTVTTSEESGSDGIATPPDSQRGCSPVTTASELDQSAPIGQSSASSGEAHLEANADAMAADALSLSPSAKSPPGTDPRQCGRRMFLASLVVATKYLQDRAYSNRAWSRVSGLSAGEITRCERKLLNWLSWNLYIPEREFSEFQTDLMDRVHKASSAAAAKVASSHSEQSVISSTIAKPPSATAHAANVSVRKDIQERAHALAAGMPPKPLSTMSMVLPSPGTPHMAASGKRSFCFHTPTPSPHPCVTSTPNADRSERKRPRADSDACEQILRDILAQRPRTDAIAGVHRSLPSQ